MIYREHFVEIFVNGHKLDLESQESLNLRFNNVMYDPEKISSTQSEYSFEFSVPSTPNNDSVFDYANNLSKLNKFHMRWDAEVYADGDIIFEGTLTLNSYGDKKYNCNLVSVKVYSLDDIFGDAVMTEIPWYIPFDGSSTINQYNNDNSSKVVFPLVSYGAFQKSPYNSDSVAKDYTSKFDLDEWNRWYIESFAPSLNMLETVKKAFEWKGYNVMGNAFDNVVLKEIFCSTNLANEQSPTYNLGNPKFGSVSLRTTYVSNSVGYAQDLKFPYYRLSGYLDLLNPDAEIQNEKWNFPSVQLYDLLNGGNVNVTNTSYMYQPNEHIIVIPADGFYKIEMSVNGRLNTTGNITASQWVRTNYPYNDIDEVDVTFPVDMKTTAPFEIQLVKNYDDNLELIKGKYNLTYFDGNPSHRTYGSGSSNRNNTMTAFPHEKMGSSPWYMPPTKINGLGDNGSYWVTDTTLGYMPLDGDIMAYDSAVSPIFICGFTTMGNDNGVGTASVMKNGYSWSKSYSEQNYAFYTQQGYEIGELIGISTNPTTYQRNEYIESPVPTFTQGSNWMQGRICCMVYLNKNDVLQLYGVQRDYATTGGVRTNYSVTYDVSLNITAASPKSYAVLKDLNYGYNSPTDYDVDLKVTNFLNKETKVSDWIQGIIDAYNLEMIQNGNNVELNVKRKFNNGLMPVVDIDDRVNSAEAKASMIEYPKSMAIMYKIDTDEWGFEKSVTPQSKLNDDDWKDYGDSGFTVVKLNDDSYVTAKSDKQLQFSYTWYDNFKWYPVDSSFNKTSSNYTTIRIPVISKYSYMIDGYDYTESMKKDGYGQPQRFWFRPTSTNSYVWTRTYPTESITIFEPQNLLNSDGAYLNLSYKVTEQSLLTEYFNLTPYLASNYVTVEAYISPEEYKMIKNGALVHFDSDLYIPTEVSGYDATGFNPTEIKMIKKIQ